MKILIVSNLYPPHYLGGYELRCAEVAEALVKSGHEVKVLTSRYGCNSKRPRQENIGGVQVERALGQYMFGKQPPTSRPYFLGFVKPRLQDARYFIQCLNQFKPDVVNWWSFRGLAEVILPIPYKRHIPDLFCVDDTWVIEEWSRGHPDHQYQWGSPWVSLWSKRNKPWYWRPILVWAMETWKKSLLREGIDVTSFLFNPTHVCFISEFLRHKFEAAGLKFSSSEVIFGGIPVSTFLFYREEHVVSTKPLRLLYVGQITKDRGIETVIESLNSLSKEILSQVFLTVVGDDPEFGSKYLQELKQKVSNGQLSSNVTFLGKKSYHDLPEIYRAHDVLIAPTTLEEGFGRNLVEGMLSGCAVVTTGSGGTMDIAKPANLPLFTKGDRKSLAHILEWLIRDRDAVRRIAKSGQAVALEKFSFDSMMDKLCKTFTILDNEAKRTKSSP